MIKVVSFKIDDQGNLENPAEEDTELISILTEEAAVESTHGRA